jgi:hypothetical protein
VLLVLFPVLGGACHPLSLLESPIGSPLEEFDRMYHAGGFGTVCITVDFDVQGTFGFDLGLG